VRREFEGEGERGAVLNRGAERAGKGAWSVESEVFELEWNGTRRWRLKRGAERLLMRG
jgi:hypothetical protein